MTITWSPEIGFAPNGPYTFPDADGVYVIAQVVDGITHVRYIGKGNIYERMESHKNWQSESNECLADVMKDTSNGKVRSAIISDSVEMAMWNIPTTNTIWKKDIHYAIRLNHLVHGLHKYHYHSKMVNLLFYDYSSYHIQYDNILQ